MYAIDTQCCHDAVMPERHRIEWDTVICPITGWPASPNQARAYFDQGE